MFSLTFTPTFHFAIVTLLAVITLNVANEGKLLLQISCIWMLIVGEQG